MPTPRYVGGLDIGSTSLYKSKVKSEKNLRSDSTSFGRYESTSYMTLIHRPPVEGHRIEFSDLFPTLCFLVHGQLYLELFWPCLLARNLLVYPSQSNSGSNEFDQLPMPNSLKCRWNNETENYEVPTSCAAKGSGDSKIFCLLQRIRNHSLEVSWSDLLWRRMIAIMNL